MSIRTISRLTVFALFCCMFCPVFSQADLLKQLNRGKYNVGFSSSVHLDNAQNYPFYLDSTNPVQKAPKPLLINVWYPAVFSPGEKQMKWSGYLDFESKQKNIDKWLSRFKAYTEEAMLNELLKKSKDKLDEADKKIIDSFLLSTTTVVRNAKVAKGKFPFIIYAQGAGGTIEDNAMFCATLASHGYVVIGSSFQYNEADYLGPQGPPASTRDIVFLLNYARSLPGIDYQKAGMMGHSLGAQKMISFMSQGNTPFDALVSLETTQEYHALENKLWDYYVADATRSADAMKGSFLFATAPTATHMLADRFRFAERNYLTIPGLGHNDYISQGVQRRYLVAQKKATEADSKRYEEVAKGYSLVCNAVIDFFNAKLKQDSSEWTRLIGKSKAGVFGSGVYIEQMGVGQTTYLTDLSSKNAPTPRQIKFLVMDGKIDTVSQLLKQYWEKGTTLDIYAPSVAFPLIQGILPVNTEKALQLYRVYSSLIGEKAIDDLFITWAQINKMRFQDREAQKLYDALFTLNPDNKEKVIQLINAKK